ncbi:CheR family methyltransferase [Actinomadura kijaniata]|uniref:CheR family methyltransferase n=1 Tax=Actinomadura kijaniata TaxID=46161 RepID=UPI000A0297A4|nr:CheR family methyltransferase [Actinomadura kijaniata]
MTERDSDSTGEPGGDQEGLQEVLRLLHASRGIDFTGYKRSTLLRRISRRMAALNARTYADYCDLLELHPEEFTRLLDSLLINVTGFFRDPAAWEVVAERVVPQILAGKAPGAPIRVWSTGCATGEEAYTLAIILAEALGIPAFQERVKIYATDVDEQALQTARTGVYAERRVQDVPPELRDRFFEPVGTGYAFRRDLRRQVIFGRNDLTRDAPISRIDLLTFRNTLMYFNSETQRSVLRRIHFSLADSGYLLLGKAEMLVHHGSLFEPVDLRKRVFRKLPGSPPPERRQAEPPEELTARLGVVRAAALAAGPVAQLAVGVDGNLVVANTRAQHLFGLSSSDVGRPFRDLEISYRPVELRSMIDQVERTLRPQEVQGAQWRGPQWQADTDATFVILDICVVPLLDRTSTLVGFGISFTDVTSGVRLREELEHANEELERAYQDVQSLNEELETTNEELQSTNEELETTNEELQSTNEELETMNEELRSTNDELQDINDALRSRTEELHHTKTFFESVWESLGHAALVLDDELRVIVWSQGATELWGLRADEAQGRHLATLPIGLPAKELLPSLQRMRRSPAPPLRSTFDVDAVNRLGHSLRLEVDALPLRQGPASGGIILLVNRVDAAEKAVSPSADGGKGRPPVSPAVEDG